MRQQFIGGSVGELAVEDDRRVLGPALSVQRLFQRIGDIDEVAVEFENVTQVGLCVEIVFDGQDVHRVLILSSAQLL